MTLPFWEDKCWGKVLHCFISPNASVSYLETLKGYRCSRHWHKYRDNHFILISGKVIVEEWSRILDYAKDRPPDLTIELLPGYAHKVRAGIIHRFRVIEAGRMVEVYSPSEHGGKVSLDDIERLDVGGPDE